MDNQQYQIIASLEAGEQVEDIVARLEIPKVTVVRTKLKYDKAIAEGTLDKLVDVDQLVLLNAAEAANRQMPSLAEEISEVTSQTSNGLDRLRKLDDQLLATALFANTRIRTALSTTSETHELEDLIGCLCKLRDAFFNKNVTQVNIQNNLSNSGTAAYGEWLNDKPN